MYLLINSVLPEGTIFTLLDAEHVPVAETSILMAGNEYEQFLSSLEEFLRSQNITVAELKTIYAVTGPASFTGGRIVTLTLGTLSLVYGVLLVWLTLFEYWELTGNAYPMAIGINASEYIFVWSSGGPLELRDSLQSLDQALRTYSLSRFQLPTWQTGIHLKHTWDQKSLGKLESMPRTSILTPLYCKKPNITLSRSSHDPSAPRD